MHGMFGASAAGAGSTNNNQHTQFSRSIWPTFQANGAECKYKNYALEKSENSVLSSTQKINLQTKAKQKMLNLHILKRQ